MIEYMLPLFKSSPIDSQPYRSSIWFSGNGSLICSSIGYVSNRSICKNQHKNTRNIKGPEKLNLMQSHRLHFIFFFQLQNVRAAGFVFLRMYLFHIIYSITLVLMWNWSAHPSYDVNVRSFIQQQCHHVHLPPLGRHVDWCDVMLKDGST